MTGNQTDSPEILADLNAVPDGVPAHPPVSTRPQVLPFGELTWENFEKLCYRLASQDERIEHVARYGRSGQAQHGIDIFVRLESGKYEVWQAKRYEAISAGDITAIVKTFREGSWIARTEKLVLAVQASLADTKVQDAIEHEAISLKQSGIAFVPWDGDELSKRLRSYPEIIDDFFGRDWVKAFLGPDAAVQLGTRLDGAEFAHVRHQLGKYYNVHFHLLDVGISLPLSPAVVSETAPSLLQRFAVPDILVRDTVFEGQSRATRDEASSPESNPPSNSDAIADSGRRREYVRRASLSSWLSGGRHLAILGEAGSGKSTLLRCIALDLLLKQGLFPEVSRRWGGLIPVHLSFSRWSRLSAREGRAIGLKELVAELLQPGLTADLISLLDRAIDEKRVLLLLDGLDEWSDEQAARTTLQQMLSFVATHDVPAITTARPRGLDKIGSIPNSWAIGELAPLSLDQQRTLARVWFERSTPGATSQSAEQETRTPIEARLDRFFAEIGRDRRLGVLGGNPLLLVGLVALSLRQIALPRNRAQAINSLISVLIETHPVQRATEAGDTHSRFPSIQDADDRRSAIARLAFVARSATGGGTYELKEARKAIRDYLADSATFCYQPERAQRAAEELLAVNAETVGLLAERAPGEVGFAHAVFEEFLAAEHMRSWAFDEVVSFVATKSAEPLWRNVIANLVSLLDRPTEVKSIVSAIEAARNADASRVSLVSRDMLLADIAFGPSRKPPATARELISGAFSTIERGAWTLARREVLKSALTHLGDESDATPVDARMSHWAPRRKKYLVGLFDVLSTWTASADLEEVLIGGLFDEERHNQRGASRALARTFAGRQDIQKRLSTILGTTLDLSVAAAALEALSIGWPHTNDLSELHDRATASLDPTLRLVGIAGRAAMGRANISDRDALVGLLSEIPEIDYWDRPSARRLLAEYWKDDPAIIELALAAVTRVGIRRHDFERESAMHYLVRCSPIDLSVSDWVRRELKEQYPFSISHDDVWDELIPFATTHSDIRTAIIASIKSDWGSHSLYNFQALIQALRDDELRDFLISISRSQQSSAEFWPVRLLVETWGRSDSVVAQFLDEVSGWGDKRLDNLAAILPRIILDPGVCRTRLFKLMEREGARFDLIAEGFVALGCTSSDDEVVEALLAKVDKGAPAFDPATELLTHFPNNARVRRHAIETLKERSPQLAILAQAYGGDAEIRAAVLAFANPLPVELRGEIADVAALDAMARPSLHAVLAEYDIEVDGELKIAGSIAYHRNMVRGGRGASEEHLARLRNDLQAVGPDFHERRAAAFAGMLILGHVHELIPMIAYGDKPLNISSGTGYGEESDSLMALMAERWDELSAAFGDQLASRFGDFGGDEGHLWDCLAPHLSAASASVRRDFLRFVDRTDTTLGVRSLIALAREQPSSEVLLRHCWRVFGQQVLGQHERHSPWAVQRLQLEIAYILRDHYRGRPDVLSHLREALKRGQQPEVVALSLLAPTDPLLDEIQIVPIEIGRKHSDWLTAVHLASARSDPADFVQVVLEMVARPLRSNWDFQEIANRTTVERIARDADSAALLKARLLQTSEPNEIASLPRYLSAAGALDSEINRRCHELLERESLEPLPRAGYDAVADTITALSRSLLEVITPSFSV